MKGDPATRREFEALVERVVKLEDQLRGSAEASAALDTGVAEILDKSPDGPTGPTGPGTPLPDDVPWCNGSPVRPEVIKGPVGSVGPSSPPGGTLVPADPPRFTDPPGPPVITPGDAGDSTAAAAAPTVLGDATV